MCPLRVILIFLSAVVAGYFAWQAVRAPPPLAADQPDTPTTPALRDAHPFDARKVIGGGLWMFMDMASGRYLWRAIKGGDVKEEERN